MNYYERHLGDYAKDTGHLSVLEHGAYTLLLDRYYSTEVGIPETQAFRLARARTPEEREAVDTVLAEFFELVGGVWINRRAEEEIEKARVRIGAAKENGRKGGRPKKNPAETQQKPSGLFVGYENETQTEPSEKLTKHQAPDTNVNPMPQSAAFTEPEVDATYRSPPLASPIGSDPITTRACELAGLLRQRGAALTATNPDVRRWAEEGVSDAQALQALEVAQQRRADKADPSAIPAGYLTPIIRDLRNQPPGGGARASPRGISRDEGRAIAASTRLSNFRAAVAADQRTDDERTLETPATPRLLG